MYKIDTEFRRELKKHMEEAHLLMCYQCGICSSNCPVFQITNGDFNPRKIVQFAYLGIKDILKDRSIWSCTTCYECFENCPQKINFVDLIIVLRNLAFSHGYAPKSVVDELNSVNSIGKVIPETERIKRIKEKLYQFETERVVS